MSAPLPLAGRGRRFVATLIDAALVPVVAILLMLVTGVLEHAQDWSESAMPFARMFGLGLASYVLLNLWLLLVRGQTLGKTIMGIMIVTAKTGAKAPLWRLFFRGLFFPTLYLIVLIPFIALIPVIDQVLIFRKDRRCIHDWACGTAVVRREAA
jgi:uncharacterized RDD family membrane protein YckC